MTTTDLVEWLNSFTGKPSNHHRGFESQNLVNLYLFVEEIDFSFHESFMYLIHVNAPNLFHSTPRPSRHFIAGTAKMRVKLAQLAHWANEIPTLTQSWPVGLRNFTVMHSNIW